MLHIIRMHDRPKTIRDLVRLANREDIPNMQYSLRKLIGQDWWRDRAAAARA